MNKEGANASSALSILEGVKKTTNTKKTQKTPLPFSLQQISQEFERKTNFNTEIKLLKNGKGKLIITFKNEEQLEHLIQCFQSE